MVGIVITRSENVQYDEGLLLILHPAAGAPSYAPHFQHPFHDGTELDCLSEPQVFL